MKKKPTTYLSKTITNILGRLNLILFIVAIVGGLIWAIIILNGILQAPSSIDGTTTKNNGSQSVVDQTTLNSLNKLNTSDKNSSAQTLPSGRINPFSE